MGERYWITGVQLGMLKAFAQMNYPEKEHIEKIIDEIIDNQFMGNTNDSKVTERVRVDSFDESSKRLKDSDKEMEDAFYHTDAKTNKSEGGKHG